MRASVIDPIIHLSRTVDWEPARHLRSGFRAVKAYSSFTTLFIASRRSTSRYQRWCFFRPAAALPSIIPLIDPFHPERHIHMDKDGVDQNDGRCCVNQQAIANHLHREYSAKYGRQIITPVTSSTNIMLMMVQNIIFARRYIYRRATLCSLPFSTSTMPSATEYPVYQGCYGGQKRTNINISDKISTPKNGCRIRPICGVPKVSVSWLP